MRVFMDGERISPFLDLRIQRVSIEAAKWVALAAMLVEHFDRYVLGATHLWAYSVGRIAFPLFVFALAAGLAQSSRESEKATLRKLVIWACIAQAASALVRAQLPFNVIFTLAIGVGLHLLLTSESSRLFRWPLTVVLAAAGVVCEFGLYGVAFIVGAIAYARAPRVSILVGLWLTGGVLAVDSQSVWVLAGFGVAVLFGLLNIEIPRVRGIFYYAYAGQFVALAFIARVLP